MEEKKSIRRRTRNETNTERNYSCGCGKTYLSYPALYLHLKLKHNGQQPQGTVLNRRNYDLQYQQESRREIFDNQSILVMAQQLNSKKEELIDHAQAHKILSQIVIQQKYNTTLQSIYQNFLQSKLHRGEKNSNELWNIKIYETFAIYLLQSYQYYDEEQFKHLAYFIFFFALSLDEYGWNILQRIQVNYEQNQSKNNFSLENNCEHILEISNEFVTDYLPKDLQKVQIQSTFEKNINMTQYFTNWLYENTFTNSKLQPQGELQQN